MIAGLPYDAEVEYIDSVVPAYIDTGVPVSGDLTAIICDAAFLSDASVLSSMLGSENDYYGNIRIWASINRIEMNWGGYHIYSPLDALGLYERHIFMFTPSGCFVDGTQISTGNFHGSTNPTIKIAGYNTGNTQRQGRCRYWGFKILGSDEHTVMDMIPVRFTNSNGQPEGAMYDRVSRRLFRNAGTGSFTIGPDVATPVMGLHFMPRPKYTARDYVQKGLVAMWDGEWNAGPGVHDPNATTWQDLSEYANTASVAPANATPIWGDKYFTMHSGATGFISGENSAYASLLTTPSCTFELAFEMLENLSLYAIVYIGGVATDLGLCTIARFGSRDFVSSLLRAKGYAALESRFETDGIDLANVMCYSCGQITQTGERVITRAVGLESDVSKVQSFGSIQYSDNKIGIGCGTRGGYTSGGAANIYSLRVYNRALTDAEIAANYAIDKARFNLP